MSKSPDEKWLAAVDSALGPCLEEHPRSRELVAFAAGELDATARREIATHLAGCPECRVLVAGAGAGLAEAEAVERGLALLEARAGRGATSDGATNDEPLHLVLQLAAAPPPRAYAADVATAEAPLPADRRVLLEEPGSHRLVYFVAGHRARLGLFALGTEPATLEAALDGQPLAVTPEPPSAQLADLGPVPTLAGRTLVVSVIVGPRRERISCTLVEAGPAGDNDRGPGV